MKAVLISPSPMFRLDHWTELQAVTGCYSDARFDSGGSMAVPPGALLVPIRLGEVTPFTCEVDQPQGMNAGELMAETAARLARLLAMQTDAFEAREIEMARECGWNAYDLLANEIRHSLATLQRLGATPAQRCIA